MSCCPRFRQAARTAAGLVLLTAVTFGVHAGLSAADPAPKMKDATVLDHKVETLSGAQTDLAQYRGKVVLVVNVASKCGYTPQYEGLETIYEKYRDRDFVILGFPSNQFGGQEPGTPSEIATFCKRNYGVEFPLMGKVEVKGSGATPLYRELTAEGMTDDPGPVKWNFEKFLIGRDGKPVARFRSKVKPESKEMTDAIEAELKKPAPGKA